MIKRILAILLLLLAISPISFAGNILEEELGVSFYILAGFENENDEFIREYYDSDMELMIKGEEIYMSLLKNRMGPNENLIFQVKKVEKNGDRTFKFINKNGQPILDKTIKGTVASLYNDYISVYDRKAGTTLIKLSGEIVNSEAWTDEEVRDYIIKEYGYFGLRATYEASLDEEAVPRTIKFLKKIDDNGKEKYALTDENGNIISDYVFEDLSSTVYTTSRPISSFSGLMCKKNGRLGILHINDFNFYPFEMPPVEETLTFHKMYGITDYEYFHARTKKSKIDTSIGSVNHHYIYDKFGKLISDDLLIIPDFETSKNAFDGYKRMFIRGYQSFAIDIDGITKFNLYNSNMEALYDEDIHFIFNNPDYNKIVMWQFDESYFVDDPATKNHFNPAERYVCKRMNNFVIGDLDGNIRKYSDINPDKYPNIGIKIAEDIFEHDSDYTKLAQRTHWVAYKEKSELINMDTLKPIVNLSKYNTVTFTKYGYIITRDRKKYGLMDFNGNTILEPIYDTIQFKEFDIRDEKKEH